VLQVLQRPRSKSLFFFFYNQLLRVHSTHLLICHSSHLIPSPITLLYPVSHTQSPSLTCKLSVAQHGYATVFNSGQSHDFIKLGIFSECGRCVLDLVAFTSMPDGINEGTSVTTTLSDVDAGTGTVGSACGCGIAATNATRVARMNAVRILTWD
jgi:bacterioferritin-associated ferredoxin